MAEVIPIAPQPEPGDFNRRVREPGRRWMVKSRLDPEQAPSPGMKVPRHWRKIRRDLKSAYADVCAYWCIPVLGGATVDHFQPIVSAPVRLAFEWPNYRLACSEANTAKAARVGILDPFTMAGDSFHLTLSLGSISLNPALDMPAAKRALFTIQALDLNNPGLSDARRTMWVSYYEGAVNGAFLERWYPFLWQEIVRQRLQR